MKQSLPPVSFEAQAGGTAVLSARKQFYFFSGMFSSSVVTNL